VIEAVVAVAQDIPSPEIAVVIVADQSIPKTGVVVVTAVAVAAVAEEGIQYIEAEFHHRSLFAEFASLHIQLAEAEDLLQSLLVEVGYLRRSRVVADQRNCCSGVVVTQRGTAHRRDPNYHLRDKNLN